MITHRRGFTLIDLAIALACLLLVTAILLTGIQAPRSRSDRVKCASNLRQIGQGMLLYANEFKAYPRVRYTPGAPLTQYTGSSSSHPFNAPDSPAPNDVTAALYLLVRNADLHPEIFVCPSTSDQKWDQGGRPALAFSNFPADNTLSYALANPYPSDAATALGYRYAADLPQDVAIAADQGPAVALDTSLTSASAPAAKKAANSPNHDREGQNVLFADGHVDWGVSPFAGADKDHIYAAAAVDRSGETPRQLDPARAVPGTDPQCRFDSILLPAGVTTYVPDRGERLSSEAILFIALLALVLIALILAPFASRSPKPGAS